MVGPQGREDIGTQPTSDAYVGMMLVTLVAMMVGCFLLYLDFAQ